VRALAAATLLLLLASPAFAQRSELALLAGYTTAGDIDMKTMGIQTLEVAGSFTWGAEAGHFFTDHVGAEVSWTRQQSAMVVGTSAGSRELFDMKLDALQGSFVYQLGAPAARLRPFLLAGLGATFLSAPGLESETKLSWAVGAGLKYFPSSRWGLRAQGRYAPTQLDDSASEVCDPFGFCQGSLHQFELVGGLVLRF